MGEALKHPLPSSFLRILPFQNRHHSNDTYNLKNTINGEKSRWMMLAVHVLHPNKRNWLAQKPLRST